MSSSTLVDVVIPVYNEEEALEPSIATLSAFLEANCPYRWRIVIADNASTDRTPEVGRRLAERSERVDYVRLEQKGRGRALRYAWSHSPADVLSYMDVDLSTDLSCFLPLIEPLAHGRYGVAIGSRLAPGAKVRRGLKREVISRIYNLMIRILFPRKRFSDAQCGFKAITQSAARELLPLVKDQAWFFDSELLLKAEARGYRIHEVPVKWVDDPGTSVRIAKTAWEDIKGLVRVRFGG
ncbi:MAG: glycosyltransferase family 2 protein [Anaerolineae bacterium]|nr:glycosyltransferase family 2 protein [Anaerolineae bacterium]